MSLLVLFMVVGEAKFAVRSCTEPAENSKNLKKWLEPRIYPSAATATPATGKGKKERRKKLFLAARMSFPYLQEHLFVLLAKEDEGCQPLKVGVKYETTGYNATTYDWPLLTNQTEASRIKSK